LSQSYLGENWIRVAANRQSINKKAAFLP